LSKNDLIRSINLLSIALQLIPPRRQHDYWSALYDDWNLSVNWRLPPLYRPDDIEGIRFPSLSDMHKEYDVAFGASARPGADSREITGAEEDRSGGGFAALFGREDGGGTGSRGDFNHFKTELALGDFLEGDIHEGKLRIIRDEGTKALPKLADPLGNDVHENLGAMHNFEGVLNERMFHKEKRGTMAQSGKAETTYCGGHLGDGKLIF
jgi:hypothetical protein